MGIMLKYVDWFSGKKDAFEQSKHAIKLTAAKGIFVTASMIMTPRNINELFSTVQLAKKLGASSFRVSTIVPLGRASNNKLHFSPENIKLLTDEISKVKEVFGDFIFETPEYLLKSNEKTNNCGAGTKSITITPNEDIKICPLASTSHLYLGNLQSKDITSLLSRNERLNFFESKDPRTGLCGQCEFLWFCEGCIARGCQMYDKIGSRCHWGEEYFINFLEHGGKSIG